MSALDRIRAAVDESNAPVPDAYEAIDELAQRLDVMLRILQGTTGYMRNGWDDLPTWARVEE